MPCFLSPKAVPGGSLAEVVSTDSPSIVRREIAEYYRDAVGHIHEFWWDVASGWSTGDLTVVSGGPPAAGDPVGFTYRPRDSQHVFYRTSDGHVHELRWR